MMIKSWIVSIVGVIVIIPGLLWAQESTIFEHNRGETNPAITYSHVPYFTRTPNFRPNVPAGKSVTIFEGGYQTNSFCNFDIVKTVEHVFEQIPAMGLIR